MMNRICKRIIQPVLPCLALATLCATSCRKYTAPADASMPADTSTPAATASVTLGDPAKPGFLASSLLDAYARGARNITIAPGTYVLPATGKTSIELNDWANATIHAAGVTIVFEGMRVLPVLLNRCENVTLEGATLQQANPAFTQGRVTALGEDSQGAYLDVQVDAGYPLTFEADKSCNVVDQATRLLKVGTLEVKYKQAELLAPGRWRMRQNIKPTCLIAVGDWLVTRAKGGPTVQISNSSRCTMSKVTIKNSGFAAFFDTDGEGGNKYLDCLVTMGPKPAGATEEQLVGCGADGFHASGPRVGPIIERCTWEGILLDDGIAIHGIYQMVVGVDGPRVMLENKGLRNRGRFREGERVRICSRDGYYSEFKCLALRNLEQDGGLLEVTLDRESGAPAGEGVQATNPERIGSGYRILNCTLRNTRSRGILVKGDNGLIEGNVISGCGMSGIAIGPEWHGDESDYVTNVVIRGNTLSNNVTKGIEQGAVFVDGDGAMGNRNITISGNRFDRNYGQNAILARDTDGLLISDNRFVCSPLPLPNKPGRNICSFKSAKNIIIRGNVVDAQGADDKLVNIGERVEGVTGNDASGIARGSAQNNAGVLEGVHRKSVQERAVQRRDRNQGQSLQGHQLQR